MEAQHALLYVTVEQAEPKKTIPPPGQYFVDAAIDEIIPKGIF